MIICMGKTLNYNKKFYNYFICLYVLNATNELLQVAQERLLLVDHLVRRPSDNNRKYSK